MSVIIFEMTDAAQQTSTNTVQLYEKLEGDCNFHKNFHCTAKSSHSHQDNPSDKIPQLVLRDCRELKLR